MTTDTIIGQLGGGGGGLIVDPLAWDVKTGKLRKRGTVLFYDDFEVGYGGWANHFHWATANTIISRTTQYPYSGDKCLLLSPHELPMNQAEKWKGAGAYNRKGFPRELGVQSLSGQVAIRGGRGTELLTEKKFPFERAWIGMDGQMPDGSKRFFGVAYLKDEGNGTTAWYLKGGYQSSAAGAGTNPDVKIPGSEDWGMGLNEWKGNFNYWRLTVDLAAAIAGTGYYLELQIGNRVFDLKKMGLPVPHDLLLKNGSLDTFSGGNNAGFGISRSILNPTFNQVQMLIDNTMFTTNDLALVA